MSAPNPQNVSPILHAIHAPSTSSPFLPNMFPTSSSPFVSLLPASLPRGLSPALRLPSPQPVTPFVSLLPGTAICLSLPRLVWSSGSTSFLASKFPFTPSVSSCIASFSIILTLCLYTLPRPVTPTTAHCPATLT